MENKGDRNVIKSLIFLSYTFIAGVDSRFKYRQGTNLHLT